MILLVVLGVMALLAASVPALTNWLGRNAGYPLAAGYLIATFLLGLRLPTVLDGRAGGFSLPWLPTLGAGLALRVDALSMVFGLLVLGVGALIMAYCPRYLVSGERHRQIYLMLTLFTTAMLGLVFAADLLLLFVFWELTSILSFVLIGGASPDAARPAVRALLITSGGGIALLVAVVLLTITTGTTSLTTVVNEPDRLPTGPTWAIGALIILAAFTKSAQVPFHFWLPNAMVAITPVSAYLHAATMVKAGIYLLLRFSAAFGGRWGWDVTLIVFGLVTAIMGAWLALRQNDLKALLAYSTVSQLGLLVGVIGVGTSAADVAAILYTVAHALFKATLFMLVGIIDHEAGNRDLRRLSGLRREMPVTVVLTVLAAMSMAGLPPTLGFVGKEAIFEALAAAPDFPWLGALAAGLGLLASALTFAYAARLVHGIFAGPTRQPGLYEPPRTFLAPAAIAAAATIILGPTVAVLSDLVVQAAQDARPHGSGEAPYLTFWHGLTFALGLTGLTVVFGLLIFWWVLRRGPAPDTGTPLLIRSFDRGYALVLRIGARIGQPARADAPAAHLVVPVLALVVLGAAGVGLTGGLPGSPPTGLSRPMDWLVLVLLLPTLGALLVSGSALAAICLTALVGLLLASWFLLAGAPDVALTLMLVEVLTTVVAMLVLRRKSSKLPNLVRLRERWMHALLAVAAGVVSLAVVAELTGRRPISGPGDYYLTEGTAATGGSNLVNVLLVDFRALDTLGEAVVIATVAIGLRVLVRSHLTVGFNTGRLSAQAGRGDPVLAFAYRSLAPVMVAVSVYLFIRGYNEPGGGFIGALIVGIAVALGRLAHPGVRPPLLGRLRATPLLAVGLLLSLVVGTAAVLGREPFLTPAPLRIPTVGQLPFSSSILFDLGIYLMVLAMIVAAVRNLDEDPTAGQALPPANTAAPVPGPAGSTS